MDNRPSDKGDIFDIVFLIGEDQANKHHHHRHCLELESECKRKNLNYIFVGNGRNGATLDDIKKLPRARHVAIVAHSKITNDKHHVILNRGDNLIESMQTFFSLLPMPGAHPSLDVIKLIQQKTQATNFIFGSCYAGKITNEIMGSKKQELLEGTSMLIASSADEASYLEDTILIVNNLVKKISAGKEVVMLELVRDSIKTNPNTMEFIYQPGDGSSIETHTMRRTERAEKEICIEIEKFCQYRLDSFNEYIGELIKNNKNKKVIEQAHTSSYPLKLEMTPIQIQTIHKRSFERHVLYNDFSVVERLLVAVQFTAMMYMQVLCSVIDDAVLKKNNSLIPMIKLLLDHKENTINWNAENSLNEAMERHINIRGFNPLTLAIEHENSEIIDLLLQHGADVFMPDQQDRTPITMLLNNPKYKMIGEKYLSLSTIIENKASPQYDALLFNENKDDSKISPRQLIDTHKRNTPK